MPKTKQEKSVNFEKKYKKELDTLNVVSKETNDRIYGINKNFLDTNKESFERAKETINKVNQKYSTITGSNVIEFFNSSIYQGNVDNNKKNIKNKDLNSPKKDETFNRALEASNNTGLLNNVFFQEKERIRLYTEYRSIEYYIPLVHQAIEAIADAIISPDDYSKDVFEKRYGNATIEDSNITKQVLENLENIENIYHIEEKSKHWIRKSLIEGDHFVAVLKYKDEFDKLLSESTDNIFLNEATLLNESNFIFNEEEQEVLNQLFCNEDSEENNQKGNVAQQFMNMINESITFTTNTSSLFAESIQINKDFTPVSTEFDSSFESIKNTILKNDKVKDTNNQRNKEIEKKIKNINKDNNEILDKTTNTESINIAGSYIKELEPDATIKLKVNNTCFGYYYMEGSSEQIKNFSSVNTSNYSSLHVKKNLDFLEVDDALKDPKAKIILDIFARALSTKLNKKFIEDNKEFKQVIFELLKQDYITQKRVKITFLNPDQVFHFRPSEDVDGYGISELKKVIFTCKLYLSVLISNLMMKLSRSVDHRAFYVETGLSNDVENVIQSFIRDIKTKEVKLSDVQTIDTIFKTIGKFHDYFIPTVNGERPVDFEIISGQDVNMDDDLLEYLRKSIISGLGIPSSYLNMLEEVDFARSIAMQNAKFLRNIVVKQKSYNRTFCDLYKALYRNEYETELNSENNSVNVDAIQINFPSPSTLNMTNLADQISTAQSVIDFVTQTLGGQDGDNKELDLIRKVVTKKLLPSLHLDEYEELIKNEKVKIIEEDLLNNKSNEGEENMY